MILNKTVITELNNCYIDCTHSDKQTTLVSTIETPDPKGNEVRDLFTIRTKDGYNLKYDDKTGKIVYRFFNNSSDMQATMSEAEVAKNYSKYFNEYTFDLKTLATYKNTDPVSVFETPYYRVPSGGGIDGRGYKHVPKFEYNDIEEQKENIFLIDTGFKTHNDEKIYVASYYGNNPNKCKLELVHEVIAEPVDGPEPSGGDAEYFIKTTSGRMFDTFGQFIQYGMTEWFDGGETVANIASISANAEKVGSTVEEDNTHGLFTTYVVSQKDLNTIANSGKIYSEIIINTFSYPVKFNDTDLLETNIKIANTPLNDVKGKVFRYAEPKIKIFSFNVPYLKDVENCKLLLPFNGEIALDYDVIRGKIINGYIQYEVSTNSTTLYIDNSDFAFYKDNLVLETIVPYKPTGEFKDFKETEKRLGKQAPILLIKCLQEEQQQHFIQGTIQYPIKGILKEELDLLNQQLEKGVITNE